MKRLICLALILLLFCGCQDHNAPKNADFYYPRVKYEYNSPGGIFGIESRPTGGNHSALELLSVYLQGPLDEDLSMPFPGGLAVSSVTMDGHTIYITVTDELATLSGAPLILACSCLGQTAMALCGTQSAEIRCENLLLDGKKTITINSDTVIYSDSYSVTESGG